MIADVSSLCSAAEWLTAFALLLIHGCAGNVRQEVPVLPRTFVTCRTSLDLAKSFLTCDETWSIIRFFDTWLLHFAVPTTDLQV